MSVIRLVEGADVFAHETRSHWSEEMRVLVTETVARTRICSLDEALGSGQGDAARDLRAAAIKALLDYVERERLAWSHTEISAEGDVSVAIDDSINLSEMADAVIKAVRGEAPNS